MKKKIVIVDDDTNSCRVWEKWLKDSGYDVLVINDSIDVCLQIKEAEPQLLLIDILLPGKDGLKLSQEIREYDVMSDVPIVFMSAIYKRTDVKSYLQHISDSFLEKPFNKQMLFAKVKEILGDEEVTDTGSKSVKQQGTQSSQMVNRDNLSKASQSTGNQAGKDSTANVFHIDLPELDDSFPGKVDTAKSNSNSGKKSDSDIEDQLNQLLKKSKF